MKYGRPRFLPNGDVEYPKKGSVPPPPIQGYERDPGNAWRFIRQWPDCAARSEQRTRKGCGAVEVSMICLNVVSDYDRKRVSHTICESCPVRASD